MTLTQIQRAGLDEIALDHVFTIGASGTDHYTFQGEGLNGTVNDPTLYLTRGKTYRFENGSGGHPIRIQSTSGPSGTAYNTGVTNNAGTGTVIMEVQHDAPDVLYYQCTSHANMNGILYITGALADSGVTTAKLADDAVTGAKLADNAVVRANITDGEVISAKLDSNAVTTSKINNNAITADKIATNGVTEAKIATDAVTVNKIAAGSVTTAKIADDAVTSAKIGTDAVDSTALAANAVTSAHIAANTITADDIATDAVGSAELAANAVSTAHIADDAVTDAKINGMAASKLTGALPAISGANLTNLPGGGKITRIFSVTSGTDYQNASWGDYMTITVTNVPSSATRYLLFISYNQQTQNASYPSYSRLTTTNASVTGYNFQHTTTSNQSSIFHNGFTFDAGNSTSNRTYKIQHRASSYDYNKQSILSSGSMVIFELDMS